MINFKQMRRLISLILLYLFSFPCQVQAVPVQTQLGEIDTEPAKLAGWLLNKSLYLGGGIAFLLFIKGAFTLLTSSGNPEKVNDGKETIVSVLAGLFLIIFGYFILRIVGVNILKIPDFEE